MSKSANSGEKYLLDALDRVARNPLDYSVLYVNISKLRPKNRHPEFVKIFARMFDSIVGVVRGQLFVLSNGDFAILGKNITGTTVDEAVKKIRLGLSSDPIIHGKSTKDFAKIYYFPEDYTSFYIKIQNMYNEDVQDVDVPQETPKRPISADEIDDVIAQLDTIDIPEIIKRQSAIKILAPNKFKVAFQEFFVAVKDLSKHLDESLDLLASRWLFLYLTQTLDKKTLNAFFYSDIVNWPEQISLNLNLSSVFSHEFVHLAKNFLKPEQKLIVEVQLMDVFNNLPLYFKVKDILHMGGHKLLIDSVSPSSLKMLKLKRLDPDMVKVFWEPLLEYDDHNEMFKKVVEDLGEDNVVLAKCDTNAALKWGLEYKINTFQGPIIDKLEVALLQKRCPDAANCTAADCLHRKKLLWGSFRDECTQKEILEELL